MARPSYVLAIDQETTSTRAIPFDRTARVRSIAHAALSAARRLIDDLVGAGKIGRCRHWRQNSVDDAVASGDGASLKLIVSPLAAKELAALPGRDRRALFDKVEAFAADPFATHPAVRRMRGHEDRIRVRHGDWRAVCRIDRAAATVTLERVAHRREIYR